jgi:hypothetical protein
LCKTRKGRARADLPTPAGIVYAQKTLSNLVGIQMGLAAEEVTTVIVHYR